MFPCSHAQKQITQPDCKLWDKQVVCTTHLFFEPSARKMTFNTSQIQIQIQIQIQLNSLSLSSHSHVRSLSSIKEWEKSSFILSLPFPSPSLFYLNHRTTTQPFSLSPKFAHCNQTLPLSMTFSLNKYRDDI